VDATIKVKASKQDLAEDFLKEVKILIERSGDRLHIEADHPKTGKGGGFFDWIFGKRVQLQISYKIRVPEKTDLDLKITNGNIDVTNVEGQARLRSTNGSVEANRIRGGVDGYTVNGNVHVQLAQVTGNRSMKLKTTNGSLQLRLPSDIQVDLEASTVNGSISTEFPVTATGRLTSRSLRGSLNGGGPLIDLHTVNGSIRIEKE
jgi:DUF4097 and DUF4098 domain-containing protein YvlB